MSYQAFFWIGLGGFFGANARYILSTYITSNLPILNDRVIPFGTAFVNITGSLLLALFLAYISKRGGVPDHVKLLIGTGFLGAYTTFSTYANESMTLFAERQWLTALSYIFGTNLLCLLGVALGLLLADKLF